LTFSDTAFSGQAIMDAQAGLTGTTAQGQQNIGVYASTTVPQAVNGFAIITQFHYVPVPEPSTLTLSGLTALAGLAYRSFGRRRAKAAA
jgi:hypothetical protein